MSTNNDSSTSTTQTSVEEKLDALISEVQRIKEEQAEIKKSVEFCRFTLKFATYELKTQCIKLDLCYEDMNYLKIQSGFFRRKLNETSDWQQIIRQNTVELHGVPEQAGEDIVGTVLRVVRAFDYDLKIPMFYATQRLPKSPFRPMDPRRISFKFINYQDKENFMKMRKFKMIMKASELGYRSNTDIYFTDSLAVEDKM